MPRKKKIETEAVETEEKTTKKRATKKVEEKKPIEFSIEEMVNWTDEECTTKDKELKFYTADVRNILKSLVSVNSQLSDVTQKFNLLKSALIKGLMTGYKIVCPHCKREYIVSSMELNRESVITCKICGTEYKENEQIDGLATIADANVSEVLKDNETVVL